MTEDQRETIGIAGQKEETVTVKIYGTLQTPRLPGWCRSLHLLLFHWKSYSLCFLP